MEAVRTERSLAMVRVPVICVLDFDGDLADGLLREGAATLGPCLPSATPGSRGTRREPLSTYRRCHEFLQRPCL